MFPISLKLLRVNDVGLWHELLIPGRLSGFIAADEQHGDTSRIGRVKDAVVESLVLAPRLLHVGELRPVDGVRMGSFQVNPLFFQKTPQKINTFLLGFR